MKIEISKQEAKNLIAVPAWMFAGAIGGAVVCIILSSFLYTLVNIVGFSSGLYDVTGVINPFIEWGARFGFYSGGAAGGFFALKRVVNFKENTKTILNCMFTLFCVIFLLICVVMAFKNHYQQEKQILDSKTVLDKSISVLNQNNK